MSNSKKKIALLFSSLAHFEPEMDEGKWTGRYLVNKNHNDRLGEPPDLHELLTRIGQASVELKDFLQVTDRLANEGAQLSAIVMQADNMLNCLIANVAEKDLVEKLEILVGRYRQMYDLIHNIAYNIHESRVKQATINFLQWKGESLQPLVNQNSNV